MKSPPLPTLLLGLTIAHATAFADPAASFADLDANQDGKLVASEIPSHSQDVFEHADDDVDEKLTEKEFRSYLHYEKRLQQDHQLIPQGTKTFLNLSYVENGHARQRIDLYLPENASPGDPLPLVVWIHGGGWRKGSKEQIGQQTFLLQHGFALASMNYRLTRHDRFPAQIHDCKAAIRYLRKHAGEYGLDPDRIGVWGSSAGGHLVALLGTSGGIEELEGDLGVTGVSSKVQAVCDWFGPTDLTTMGGPSHNPATKNLAALEEPIPKFLGGFVKDKLPEARSASAATHVTSDDPPFLIMHGDQDPLVPLSQSESFTKLLHGAEVECTLVVIKGAGHGFFKKPDELAHVSAFFKRTLKVK